MQNETECSGRGDDDDCDDISKDEQIYGKVDDTCCYGVRMYCVLML